MVFSVYLYVKCLSSGEIYYILLKMVLFSLEVLYTEKGISLLVHELVSLSVYLFPLGLFPQNS